jgi:hypothetical protein
VRGLAVYLHDMYDRLSARVDFLFVYQLEAHASDVWPIGGSIQVASPHTTAQRVAVARQFQAATTATTGTPWRIPMVIDPPETNAFEGQFASWPIRFFVAAAHATTLTYIAEPKGAEFDILEVEGEGLAPLLL